ncbi:EAL domain-containing protein [Pseudomonas monteilii]|nr:EAL domain-containing protein [Pseudomonas monteilii]
MNKTHQRKILIVDDNPFQLAYIRELFGQAGIDNLHVVNNGKEALQILKRESFGLIVSDLMMPELDGVQLIQRLAELEDAPPVALMTAMPGRMLNSVAGVATALGIEIIDQMIKPLTPALIRQLLNRLGEPRQRYRRRIAKLARVYTRDEIKSALSSGDIQAWFQPKLHLASGRVFSAEALVRWHHPIDGLLTPGVFLDALAKADLELELLFHMLGQVVQAQAAWQSRGVRVKVSLNLSSHLLDVPDLPERLFQRVRGMGGVPELLVLELTEGTTTILPSSFHAAACRLRMMGFGLSQDDFGKGYSSFSNLLGIPFTELKIDRSLVCQSVNDEVCASALTSMVGLATQLGVEVVAEGVENQPQLVLMRKLKCHFVQGFHVSPALPAVLFEKGMQAGVFS